MLASLLQVGTLGGAVECDLALLAAALLANALVKRQTKAFFLAAVAQRTAQSATPLVDKKPVKLSHYGIFVHVRWVRPA